MVPPFPKPHPDPLNRILAFYGIESWEALFVGDSAVDQQAAVAAGVPFVAYRSDLQSRHQAVPGAAKGSTCATEEGAVLESLNTCRETMIATVVRPFIATITAALVISMPLVASAELGSPMPAPMPQVE